MSHVTADLEYFKCDLCNIYLHKDIFCDHRRDCKGLNSQEFKKSECRRWEAELSENTRRLLEERDGKRNNPAVASVKECKEQKGSVGAEKDDPSLFVASTRKSSGVSGVPRASPPSCAIKRHLPVEKIEVRRNERIRRMLVDEYEAAKDKEFEKKYPEEKMKELMDFLTAEN